jgi:hypothetical protein
MKEQQKTMTLDFLITPDEMILQTPALDKQIKEISQGQKYIFNKYKKGQQLSDEDLMEISRINSDIDNLLKDRKRIDDKDIITRVFNELRASEAVVINKENYKPGNSHLFALILVDNKAKGIETNPTEPYIRNLLVLKDNYVVIPINTKEFIGFAKARVAVETYTQLISLVND